MVSQRGVEMITGVIITLNEARNISASMQELTGFVDT